MNTIITINQQFSSGGREVGKRLADALQIGYYDKELISEIAKNSDFSKDYIEKYSESSISHRFLFTFANSFSYMPTLPSDSIQIAQTKIIKNLATKQS